MGRRDYAVLLLMWPLPGEELTYGSPGGILDSVIKFLALLAFLWSLLLFFQGATFAMLDGLLGVPGRSGDAPR